MNRHKVFLIYDVYFNFVLCLLLLVFVKSGYCASKSIDNENQTISISYVSVNGFNNSKQSLTSGPILIIDTKTLFITNLKFETSTKTNFWIKNGLDSKNSATVVPNEEESYGPLTNYGGENIYIKLPTPISRYNINMFGIWKNETKEVIGFITIKNNITILDAKGYEKIDAEGRRIIRVKKCCPLGEALNMNGCEKSTLEFNPAMDILDNNKTHVEDSPLAKHSMNFQPFYAKTPCSVKGPLIPDTDKFALLSNGSLVVPETKRILTQDEFCIETVNLGDENSSSVWLTTALWCLPDEVVQGGNGFTIVLGIGIILSIISLTATALIFFFCKEKILKSARGRSIAFFSICMTVSFVCLAIVYFFTVSGTTCTVIGFVFQGFLISSFAWLLAISSETLMKIRNYNNSKFTEDTKRFWVYLALAIFLPVIVIGISVVFDQNSIIPNIFFKPELGKSSCWFEGEKKRVFFFYIPIIALLLINIVVTITMKVHLVKLESEARRKTDISWITMKDDLKSMFRSSYLILFIMTFCWMVEIISYFVESSHPVWFAADVITSVQGVFVLIVFVLHRPIKDRIWQTKGRIQSWRWRTPPASPETMQLNDEFKYPKNAGDSLLSDNNMNGKNEKR